MNEEQRNETNGFDDVCFVLWNDDLIGKDVQLSLSKVADDLLRSLESLETIAFEMSGCDNNDDNNNKGSRRERRRRQTGSRETSISFRMPSVRR